MPRNAPKTLDLVASIGLRAPATNNKKELYDLLPCVRQLYQVRIPELYDKHDDETSDEVAADAIALLEEYGPRIWRRGGPRPWLFNAGEAKDALYEKDLYFDDHDDYDFLCNQFCAIVRARILRYHQDEQRSSNHPSSFSTESHSHSPSPNFSNDSCVHLDATTLKKQGVWLGDWRLRNGIVNGRSWSGVEERFYFKTNVGRTEWSEGPHVLKEQPRIREQLLQCAQCTEGLPVTVKCVELCWKEGDGLSMIQRHVWVYPCTIGKREVFALVRPSPQASEGTSKWAFWMLSGGHTSRYLLEALPNITETYSETERARRGDSSALKRPSDEEVLSASKRLRKNPARRATQQLQNHISPVVLSLESDSAPQWNTINDIPTQASLHQAVSSKAAGKQPVRNAHGEPSIPDNMWNTVGRQNTNHDFDSMYDRTPPLDGGASKSLVSAVEQETSNTNLQFVRYDATEERQSLSWRPPISAQRSARYSETMRPESPRLGDTRDTMATDGDSFKGCAHTTPFAGSFTFYFTVDKSSKYNVVKLDTSGPFETAYGRIGRKLVSKFPIKEGRAFDFTVRLAPFTGSMEMVEVEVDDDEAWDVVLEKVKENRLKDVYGTVSIRV